MAQGIPSGKLTSSLLDEAALQTAGTALKLGDEAVRDALDPRRFVETRVTDGSVSPLQVARLLAHAQTERTSDRRWVEDARARLVHAQRMLDQAVSKLVPTAQAA
jgi:argininosuccinate lyase